jgi:hypothetical protein
VDKDELLRQRIVIALDSLPVPPAPGLRWDRATARGFGGFSYASAAAVAAVLLAVLLLASVLLPGARPASQPIKGPFIDDFSSGIDRARWSAMTEGNGATVAAANGRVEMTISANATQGPDPSIRASLSTPPCARGDYVASVDYAILDWPPMNGTQIQFGEFSGNVAIYRVQYGGVDTDAVGANNGITDNRHRVDGRVGSLRLVRQDGTVTVSWREGDGPWTDLLPQWQSTGDASFQILLSTSQGEFSGQTVRVAADNFSLTAAELTCA